MGELRRTGYAVRQLPSGRWQVRIVDRDTGARVPAATCDSEEEADRTGQALVADARRGLWHDPRRGQVRLSVYLADWLQRKRSTGEHSDRYAAEAERMVRLHVDPRIGRRELGELTPGMIRAWYDGLRADRIAASREDLAEARRVLADLRKRPRSRRQLPLAERRVAAAEAAAGSPGLVPAKCYRLVRAALADAARDGLIQRNPCDLKGAGVERSVERPLIEPAQLVELVAATPERWRALVLVAAWCGLRFGELAALQGKQVDLLHRRIDVVQALAELEGGRLVVKAPKSAAGRRSVAMPAPLVPILEDHLARFAEPGPDGFVFVGEKGGMLRRGNWPKTWAKIATTAGVPALKFHDLRHLAGTMAAQAGATERELQRRLGHASPNAARRYQHAAQSRDQELADRLGAMMPTGLGARQGHDEPIKLRDRRSDQR